MYNRCGWVWQFIIETLTLANNFVNTCMYSDIIFLLLFYFYFLHISFSGNSLSQVDPSQIVKNMSLATSPVEVDVSFQIKVLVEFVFVQMCSFLCFKPGLCEFKCRVILMYACVSINRS